MSAETARSVVIEREMPHPPEKVWRALTQSSLLEEWLMKNDFQPIVGHRFNFRADWGAVDGRGIGSRAEQKAFLRVGGFWSGECGHLDANAHQHGDASAHGAFGLPGGSGAGLQGRQVRVAGILCEGWRRCWRGWSDSGGTIAEPACLVDAVSG